MLEMKRPNSFSKFNSSTYWEQVEEEEEEEEEAPAVETDLPPFPKYLKRHQRYHPEWTTEAEKEVEEGVVVVGREEDRHRFRC